ncbi:hypothetical protein KAFR_0A06690 [Kazachstania africana CBS 2517]|uniref:Zn(2)-C6 fungal-type domain-containing protein n=1 Tax=Kazachstania africana (strain ATCC 22294 / BCRC 22015 / CBS 2517 / CECT 1963 / NBRC 1671 / NRRL Y-8276) TaxID=1071382 RepID=H2AP04_KAZAF|nr:hypothetical protein KAFR_0A06690 [Kazachstania africana CBS 2517]CCF56104.1 hypothetical protein KAFR_0A06690 [Kazachstania africana CBS 2517]
MTSEVKIEQTEISKRRRKVNRACDNCRKRKIKCSETTPCTNCQIYQCKCVFSSSASPPSKPNGKISKNGSSRLKSSSQLDSLGSKVSQNNSFIDLGRIDSSQHVFTAYIPSKAQFDIGSDKSLQNRTTSQSPPSGSLNVLERGLYENDLENQEDYRNNKSLLDYLSQMPNKNPAVEHMIDDVTAKLDKIVNIWKPRINFKKLPQLITETGSSKSIETHLIRNKYRKKLYLSRLCVFNSSDVAFNSESGYLSKLPLVDELFGLYSPVELFSLRGVGHLMKKCIIQKDALPLEQTLKATIYIVLRFFDMCILHLNEGCVSISNPVENYLQREHIGYVSTPSSSTGPRNISNNGDLIAIIIGKLPQPFVENLTGVSTQMLLNVMNDDLEMFRLLLEMFSVHKKHFEGIKTQTTIPPLTFANLMNGDSEKKHLIISYCKLQDILLTLCYSYYNSTLYHLSEYNSLEYLELLLKLLDYQQWLEEKYGYEKVLEVAVSSAVKIGLSRWEYYVGLDESIAEKRREVWWSLYCHEKQFSFIRGHQSMIDDTKMNCLLPKEFRELGFIDHSDFLDRVSTIPRNEDFENMSLEGIQRYGNLADILIVSDFYSNVLFSDKYTSFTNIGKSPELRMRILNDLLQQTDITRSKLRSVKLQCGKIYEFVKNKKGYFDGMDTSYLINKHIIAGELLYCIVLRMSINVVCRLTESEKPTEVLNVFKGYNQEIYDIWTKMGELLLNIDNVYQSWNCSEPYLIIFLLVITINFVEEKPLPEKNIILNLRIFEKFEPLATVLTTEHDGRSINTFQPFKSLAACIFFLGVLNRISLLTFMDTNNMERSRLVQVLGGADSRVQQLANDILDHNSYIYKYVLDPVEESGFHLNIQQMLENDYKVACIGKDGNSERKRSEKIRIYPYTALRPVNKSRCPMTEQSLPPMSISDILSPPSGSYESPFSNSDKELRPATKLSSMPRSDTQYYNLGTLEQFMHDTDMNDLFKTLWNEDFSDMKF